LSSPPHFDPFLVTAVFIMIVGLPYAHIGGIPKPRAGFIVRNSQEIGLSCRIGVME
jgi:hypothetical protein